MKLSLIACALCCVAPMIGFAAEPEVIALWPAGAPGAVGDEDRDKPTLTVYRPDPAKAQPVAVVVCPGGGYGGLAMDHEGTQIADWLNSLGATACILKYRLGPRYRHPAPLDDAQRAIQIVRHHAKQWNIDPAKIGIIGFSAGGHLTSTVATSKLRHATAENPSDPISQASPRPDFAILGYPVIAFATEYAHGGSKKNLLGDNPDPKLVESLSNERQVTSDTPPCFLFHSGEDKAVPPENSVLFYQGLRRAGVPAEMHIYERGPHGFGLGQGDPALSTWPKLCADWLAKHGFLAAPPAK